jgi:hypothetical protein
MVTIRVGTDSSATLVQIAFKPLHHHNLFFPFVLRHRSICLSKACTGGRKKDSDRSYGEQWGRGGAVEDLNEKYL